jgi:hypothetical protein
MLGMSGRHFVLLIFSGVILVMLAPVVVGALFPSTMYLDYHNPSPSSNLTSESCLIHIIHLVRNQVWLLQINYPIIFYTLSVIAAFLYWVVVVFFTRALNDVAYPYFFKMCCCPAQSKPRIKC